MSRRSCIAAAITHVVLSATTGAQIVASERGSLAQTIDGTKITIDYARPRGRNRDPLFGNPEVVVWNEVWTPGANNATTLDVTKTIRLDGHTVPTGTYSVWMVVRQTGEWTFVLDPRATLWHTRHPDSTATQIRFPIRTAVDAPYLDVLTWSIPELRNEGGTLAMQWGSTKLSMRLDVEPSLVLTLTPADAEPYVGTYDIITKTSSGEETVTAFRVTYENNILKAVEGKDSPIALVRIKPDWFVIGGLDKHGEIWQVYRASTTYEFAREGGRAVSVEERDSDDKLIATGHRRPH
ncbi:hypothetical protein BH09GEM1_BH09GEM1_28090 [soil metagenome]